MLQTWIHRIKPGFEGRLHEWFEQLAARQDELRESHLLAGVRAERAFIISTGDGPLLVYVNEVADAAAAERVFNSSMLAIDIEHKRVMDECIDSSVDVLPVYDVSA
jgi:hypothetical protein